MNFVAILWECIKDWGAAILPAESDFRSGNLC
jgi:hypothetical protein